MTDLDESAVIVSFFRNGIGLIKKNEVFKIFGFFPDVSDRGGYFNDGIFGKIFFALNNMKQEGRGINIRFF
jgi:hypothetical protein